MAIRILNITASLMLIGSVIGIFYSFEPDRERMPLPYETIVLDGEEDDDNYLKKEEWIEMMHRSAPEDNWRKMDQQYRLQNQDSKKATKDLPLYGKWRELGSNNQAGRTVYTYYDAESEEVYTAADGGQIWRGNIGEENWVPLNDHLKIPGIRFITRFTGPEVDRLLVHSSQWYISGILYSDDDGASWSVASGLENIENWGYIKRTVVKQGAEKTVYCLSLEWDYSAWQAVSCIYRSTDLGATFDKVHTFNHSADYTDIWTSPANESDLYILAKSMFYSLNEAGNLVGLGTLLNIQDGNTMLTGFDGGSGLQFYAMVRFDNLSHFYASGVNGNSWAEKGTHNSGPFMVNSFAASTDEADVLYFGGVEAFTSYDAGESWSVTNGWGQYYANPEIYLHADIPSFNSFQVDGLEYLFINTDGGTYISYDQMDNVENISLSNLRISQYYSSYTCRFDPSYTHAGSQDQGYQRSFDGMEDGAIDYTQIISGDYASMVSGDGGASLWMVYPGFAMYCPDINNSTSLALTYYDIENIQWLPRLMDNPLDPETAYMAGGHITTSGAHIILVEMNGGSITYAEHPFDFSNGTGANISALAYSPLDPDYWYVLTSERDFFYSTDAGETWTQTAGFDGPGSHYFYGASIAPSKNTLGIVYAGGSGYSNPGVYRSEDNGETFTDFSDGLPNTMVFHIALSTDDSLLFAATEVGAFACKTWNGEWYSLADSVIPDQSFWSVDFVDTLKVARFATYGRGIWDFQLDPDVTADFTASTTFVNPGGSVDFTDLSLFSPISWSWYFEGGMPETSEEQNPTGIVYAEYGNYDVRLIVSNDQSTDTLLKEDYISVGIVGVDALSQSFDMQIRPNPARDRAFVEATQRIDRVAIYGTSGELVLVIDGTVEAGSPLSIDLSGLSRGIYLLEVTSGTEKYNQKLVKN